MKTSVVAAAGEAEVDRLARVYVFRTALQSPKLVDRFDRLTGAHLGEHGEYAGHQADVNDLDAFRSFAEDALWDRAPQAVRGEIRTVVLAAFSTLSRRAS